MRCVIFIFANFLPARNTHTQNYAILIRIIPQSYEQSNNKYFYIKTKYEIYTIKVIFYRFIVYIINYCKKTTSLINTVQCTFFNDQAYALLSSNDFTNARVIPSNSLNDVALLTCSRACAAPFFP